MTSEEDSDALMTPALHSTVKIIDTLNLEETIQVTTTIMSVEMIDVNLLFPQELLGQIPHTAGTTVLLCSTEWLIEPGMMLFLTLINPHYSALIKGMGRR